MRFFRSRMKFDLNISIMINVAIFTLITVLAFAPGLPAKSPPGLSFLRLGLDARGIALGGAMTSAGTGLSAILWNPAGLVAGVSDEIALSHMRGFEDIDSEFFGLLIKRGDRKAFAVTMFSNNIGGIEQRSGPTETPNGIISAHDFYAGLTCSFKLNDRIQIGMTAKYLFQKIFLNSASGFSGDFGVRYVMKDKRLNIGIALQNIGRMNAFLNERPTMPSLIRAGASYQVSQNTHSMTVSGELESLFQGNNSLRAGLEYVYNGTLSLRTGYTTGYEDRGLSIGAGVTRLRFGIDYAFMPNVTSFGSQHILTLRLKI